MKFKEYMNKEDIINEGVAGKWIGYRIEFELWDATIIMDAHTIDDAIKALQKIKNGDKLLVGDNGKIIDSKLAVPKLKTMLKSHGNIKAEDALGKAIK